MQNAATMHEQVYFLGQAHGGTALAVRSRSASTAHTDSPPDKKSRLRSKPEIKLRQLRYFLAGAEHLHFSQAAEAQCVTQSTLSHQIAELESQIGVPLFDRANKGLRLTQAGEVFRVHAQRIVCEVDVGCSALHELEDLVRGSLRIGATQSFVQSHLAKIVGGFVGLHPAVHLNVQELTALQIEQQLCSGQLDLGIAFAPAGSPALAVETLASEEMVLVTGDKQGLGKHRVLHVSQLEGESLTLLSSDHLSRRDLDSCFRSAGVAPRVVCESNSIAMMLQLVRTSNLAAIVPAGMAAGLADLHVVKLVDPTPRRSIALLQSRQHCASDASRTMSRMIRSCFSMACQPLPHVA